jgi:hypothetical protein
MGYTSCRTAKNNSEKRIGYVAVFPARLASVRRDVTIAPTLVLFFSKDKLFKSYSSAAILQTMAGTIYL